MAVGLALKLRAVFSICGDLPYNLTYQNSSKTSVYWLEGEKDDYISRERKDSYKILEKLGVDFSYRVISDCTHTDIKSAFTEVRDILRAV